MQAPDECVDVGNSGARESGPTIYFVYEENIGIASFGEDVSAKGSGALIDDKLKGAREYRLRSKKGLLAEGGRSF
jgi:hypothetical protein